jgi:hypothetical protein
MRAGRGTRFTADRTDARFAIGPRVSTVLTVLVSGGKDTGGHSSTYRHDCGHRRIVRVLPTTPAIASVSRDPVPVVAPTATAVISCERPGRWKVYWQLNPRSSSILQVEASAIPDVGYLIINTNLGSPLNTGTVTLDASATSVGITVRYRIAGADPSTAQSFTQMEALGVCPVGIPKPFAYGSSFCGGEMGMNLVNQPDATLETEFEVTAANGFDERYILAPGQREVVYFAPPLPFPMKAFADGKQQTSLARWEGDGMDCAAGRGPYCPCAAGSPNQGPILAPPVPNQPGYPATNDGVSDGSATTSPGPSAVSRSTAPVSSGPGVATGIQSTSDSSGQAEPTPTDDVAVIGPLGVAGAAVVLALGTSAALLYVFRRRRTPGQAK